MATVLIFAFGFLTGGTVIYWLALASGFRAHGRDPHYRPARRAVLRHLAAYGSINPAQTAHLLSVSGDTAALVLTRMEREHMIRAHTHRDGGTLYTRA